MIYCNICVTTSEDISPWPVAEPLEHSQHRSYSPSLLKVIPSSSPLRTRTPRAIPREDSAITLCELKQSLQHLRNKPTP
jgi:hypothetical protein